jgi:hypothetical protein
MSEDETTSTNSTSVGSYAGLRVVIRFWKTLFALSAGLIPTIKSAPVDVRSVDYAHKDQHHRAADRVKLWALSRETVRLLVKDDPNVAKIKFARKRSRTTYPVPESFAPARTVLRTLGFACF